MGRTMSTRELAAVAAEAVRAGRVGVDKGRVTLDGSVVRSARIAAALTDAAIGAWVVAA